MKAVQELVAYFDRRGKLSSGQLRKLLEQGFLAADAPMNMMGLCDTVGASYYFRVRGTFEGVVWGTDTYTGDSTLAVAAIHAGLVKADETAIVKVTVVAPLQQYKGSARHGVFSRDFGRYGTAYQLSAI
jgi:hypothetical protein